MKHSAYREALDQNAELEDLLRQFLQVGHKMVEGGRIRLGELESLIAETERVVPDARERPICAEEARRIRAKPMRSQPTPASSDKSRRA